MFHSNTKGEADFSKCIKFIQELSFQLILAISFFIKLYKDRQMSILKDCGMETKRVVFGQSPIKIYYHFDIFTFLMYNNPNQLQELR